MLAWRRDRRREGSGSLGGSDDGPVRRWVLRARRTESVGRRDRDPADFRDDAATRRGGGVSVYDLLRRRVN